MKRAVPDPAVPDPSTLSRRVETLAPLLARPGSARVHLLADSTGLSCAARASDCPRGTARAPAGPDAGSAACLHFLSKSVH